MVGERRNGGGHESLHALYRMWLPINQQGDKTGWNEETEEVYIRDKKRSGRHVL
jgi:hypothetical protein